MRYDADAALAALDLARPAAPRGGRPIVIGQLGQSLDGRIATPTGKSKYISGRRRWPICTACGPRSTP